MTTTEGKHTQEDEERENPEDGQRKEVQERAVSQSDNTGREDREGGQ